MKRLQAAGENSSGFTNQQFPQGGAFSRDLLDQKSKKHYSPGLGGGGGWLQMTSALFPNHYFQFFYSLLELYSLL